MNAEPLRKPRMSPEEYLKFDDQTPDIKYEYFNGEIFAMTGGSINHNRISRNIERVIGNKLLGSSCENFSGDMRVKIEAIDKYIYPDIVIACGNIDAEKIKGVETLLNPTVIIEILSKSTEAYDRGDKFRHYRTIPTLQEYILISQDDPVVDRFFRNDSGTWQILNSCTDMNQSLTIESIDCELSLSEIYYRVEFEKPSEKEG